MSAFVGRRRELAALDAELEQVTGRRPGRGRCILVRGRRRIGKSRLIEEFCERSGLPVVFFTASRQGDREVALFAEEAAASNLPGRDLFVATRPDTWDAALRLLSAATEQAPAIVVIDEFPYLVADEPSIEATFQKQWDRVLSKLPVLLVLVGSDLAMMEALNTHGRPFFQRGTEMVVPPLSPKETAEIAGIGDAAAAFDAYLVTGGLPLIAQDWDRGVSRARFLHDSLARPTSPLIVSAERSLAAEFPRDASAGEILRHIADGEVSFTTLSRAGGGRQAMTTNRALDLLAAKRMITKELPLSTSPSKEARYRVVDPYLRFWLRFVGPHIAEIDRGRSDLVIARIERDWATWRGRAIEPVIREALTRLSPIAGLPAADAVGGFWTRTNVPEIDIIGADRAPVARSIAYAGTIKWLDRSPLGDDVVRKLMADLVAVPGASPSTPLVAVSRAGVKASGVIALGPDDLIDAWP